MIRLSNINKNFGQYEAIKSLSLHIKPGEIHGIIGASGAGKSTLLRTVNLLERPEQGEVEVNGQVLTKLNPSQLRVARQSIGMIFQHFNLLLNKTVYDNVSISLELVGTRKSEIHNRVMECLAFVGLEHLAKQYPSQLSGGQKQRVAIARALANRPPVLLCDEPTSALDSTTTSEVLQVLYKVNQELGVTIVIVSHELSVIKSICHRVTVLEHGQIYSTIKNEPTGIQTFEKNAQHFVDLLTSKKGDMQ